MYQITENILIESKLEIDTEQPISVIDERLVNTWEIINICEVEKINKLQSGYDTMYNYKQFIAATNREGTETFVLYYHSDDGNCKYKRPDLIISLHDYLHELL